MEALLQVLNRARPEPPEGKAKKTIAGKTFTRSDQESAGGAAAGAAGRGPWSWTWCWSRLWKGERISWTLSFLSFFFFMRVRLH